MKLIKDLLSELNIQKGVKDIKIDGEDSINIDSDQTLLLQLFENLLRNAFNYGESDGILHVYCMKKEDAVNIQIQNTVYDMQELQLLRL